MPCSRSIRTIPPISPRARPCCSGSAAPRPPPRPMRRPCRSSKRALAAEPDEAEQLRRASAAIILADSGQTARAVASIGAQLERHPDDARPAEYPLLDPRDRQCRARRGAGRLRAGGRARAGQCGDPRQPRLRQVAARASSTEPSPTRTAALARQPQLAAVALRARRGAAAQGRSRCRRAGPRRRPPSRLRHRRPISPLRRHRPRNIGGAAANAGHSPASGGSPCRTVTRAAVESRPRADRPRAADLGLVSFRRSVDRHDRRGAGLDARRRAGRAGHVGGPGGAHRPARQCHRPGAAAADRPCRRALRHSLCGAGARLVRHDRGAAAGADAGAGRLRLVRHPDLDRRRGAADPARRPARRRPQGRAAALARHRRRPVARLPRLLGASSSSSSARACSPSAGSKPGRRRPRS